MIGKIKTKSGDVFYVEIEKEIDIEETKTGLIFTLASKNENEENKKELWIPKSEISYIILFEK